MPDYVHAANVESAAWWTSKAPDGVCSVSHSVDMTQVTLVPEIPPEELSCPRNPPNAHNMGHGGLTTNIMRACAPGLHFVTVKTGCYHHVVREGSAPASSPRLYHNYLAMAARLRSGLNWAADHHQALNITVVNIGIVDDFPHADQNIYPPSGHPVDFLFNNSALDLSEPVARLTAMGIIVTAASGNNGFKNGVSWPAVTPGILKSTPCMWDAAVLHAATLSTERMTTSGCNAHFSASVVMLREAAGVISPTLAGNSTALSAMVLGALRATSLPAAGVTSTSIWDWGKALQWMLDNTDNTAKLD
eukprot:gene8028-1434_t